MLNERAMLQGEVMRRERAIADIQDEISGLQARIHAFDRTIDDLYANVDPDAIGAVQATSGRYGGRGGLHRFVLDQVRRAGPPGIASTVIRDRAAAHFGLNLDTRKQVKSLLGSVTWNLRYLARSGVVELCEKKPGRHSPGIWRMATGVTFQDLEAMVNRDGKN